MLARLQPMVDDFLNKREEFAASIARPDLFEIVDHFGLYAGSRTIGAKLFTYELLKETLNLAGDIIEFGCWKGGNLLFLAKVLYLHHPMTVKKVFGFDNFSGLPSASQEDGDFAKLQEGRYRGDEETLTAAIKLFELSGRVELVVGDALETIPQFAESNPEQLVSFAFLDFDLYEPTRVALDFIDSSLVDGGIILLDQAGLEDWPGEALALKEFLQQSPFAYQTVSNPLTTQPTVAIRKVGRK